MSSCTPPTTDNTLLVQTYQGQLEGQWSGADQAIRVFKGIAYAKPPTGERRWQAPHSPSAWEGIRKADQFGPACWQPTEVEEFVWSREGFTVNEDCLYLNVWSPAKAEAAAVMVWFHGGAHTGGMSHDRIFDGENLAREGVVLVSVNYRLGPLGFLAHPQLAAESSRNAAGNYGLLDKIAALNWVNENIAQFGGDANNITIFGQSAGSQSVCSLMASSLASGLFHKAIGQSASCINPMPQNDRDGRSRGARLIAAITPDATAQQMRALSPEALLEAAQKTNWAAQSRIVIDGWVLDASHENTFAKGAQAQVPLLLGSLSNEGHLLFPQDADLTQAQLRAYALKLAGEQIAPQLLDAYASDQAPGAVQHAIATDLFMTYGMRRWASYHARTGAPTYLYYMDHQPPAFRLYVPDRPDLKLPEGPRSAGAYHSGDLAYVFGNTRKVGMDWQAQDHAIADQVVGYWTNFAKTGNPNGAGLPDWSAYENEQQSTQLIGPDTRTIQGANRQKIDLLEQAIPLN